MRGVRKNACEAVVLVLSSLLIALHPVAAPGAERIWSSVDAGGEIGDGGGLRLGATVGQGDAGIARAPGLTLVGGFWAIVRAGAAATPTASPTSSTLTATATITATLSPTPTPPATATGSAIATATATRTSPPAATPTATAVPTTAGPSPTPTPTATQPPPNCAGDCNGDREVRVEELVTLVNIALGLQGIERCPAGDRDGDGQVAINELLLAVNRALGGCTPEGDGS